MGVQSGNNNGVDAELSEEKVKVGVEDTAVASLGNDIVALAESELGNDFRAIGASYRVVAPELELVVDALEMSVVAEDDRYVLLSCAVEQFWGLLHDLCRT